MGPMTVAMPKIDCRIPMNMGRFDRAKEDATIESVPVAMPEPPKPAMARPTINMLLLIAAPQRREPISKVMKNARNTICTV